MNVTYRDVDFDSQDDCDLLARWNNDSRLKHLINRFEDEASFAHTFTPVYFRRIGQEQQSHESYRALMVSLDDIPLGVATLEIDPLKLLCKEPHTAWISVLIGDLQRQGSGIGTLVLQHLEKLAVKARAQRIEIGVFEYNRPSLKFFSKFGYEEFARRPGFSWWDGRMWAEVRLLKSL